MNYISVRMGAIGFGVLILIFYALAGLTHINPGEVGIKIKNLGSDTGMQKDILTIGTHWVDPFTYDITSYDTRLKQYPLEDTTASSRDGQPIQVDASLEIGLDQQLVPVLHSEVGSNWFEQVVLPSAIAALRQATASILSDDVYTGKGRVEIEQSAEKMLKEKYSSLGIRLNFNVRDVQFTNKGFVDTLERKASATQQKIIEERLAESAVQEAIKVANIAEGAKQKRIKEAEAQKEEARLSGEGQRLSKEEEAKGNYALAKAEADGIRLRREALSGAGGPELVSIEWAKNLGPNVKVYAIPTGAPGTTSLMDLNGIMRGALTGGTK